MILGRFLHQPARRTRWSRPGFAIHFFLFCLTGVIFFDNRHGLLKKFESARAAKTLSAVEPRF
jgi:hypothetical protein